MKMQREILFKGKCKVTKDWVYGDLIQSKSGRKFILPIDEPDFEYGIEVIPETIGQYIGLSDKNGEKIYDGDIGEIKTQFGKMERFVVKWGIHRRKMDSGYEVDIPGYCFFIDDFAGYTFASFPIADNYKNGHDLDIIEIIGNIHDNPELLNH